MAADLALPHGPAQGTTVINESVPTILSNKKTSAVRWRISSKLIFATCVEYFDRAYYGFYATSRRMILVVFIRGNKI